MIWSRDKKLNEFILDKPKKASHKGANLLKDIIDGSFLTQDYIVRQLPFVLFLATLAVLYIGNRYQAEKMLRHSLSLQNELKELRAEAITTASELMYISKQSEVARLVSERGLELEESTEPPRRITIEKREKLN
ncbi:MAG: hypothetical protein HC896_00750 [Bacteroidales bacterium]|nr:hypothetical protein [Bacteroidales bacterium]